jgi:hypothetical protein
MEFDSAREGTPVLLTRRQPITRERFQFFGGSRESHASIANTTGGEMAAAGG